MRHVGCVLCPLSIAPQNRGPICASCAPLRPLTLCRGLFMASEFTVARILKPHKKERAAVGETAALSRGRVGPTSDFSDAVGQSQILDHKNTALAGRRSVRQAHPWQAGGEGPPESRLSGAPFSMPIAFFGSYAFRLPNGKLAFALQSILFHRRAARKKFLHSALPPQAAEKS